MTFSSYDGVFQNNLNNLDLNKATQLTLDEIFEIIDSEDNQTIDYNNDFDYNNSLPFTESNNFLDNENCTQNKKCNMDFFNYLATDPESLSYDLSTDNCVASLSSLDTPCLTFPSGNSYLDINKLISFNESHTSESVNNNCDSIQSLLFDQSHTSESIFFNEERNVSIFENEMSSDWYSFDRSDTSESTLCNETIPDSNNYAPFDQMCTSVSTDEIAHNYEPKEYSESINSSFSFREQNSTDIFTDDIFGEKLPTYSEIKSKYNSATINLKGTDSMLIKNYKLAKKSQNTILTDEIVRKSKENDHCGVQKINSVYTNSEGGHSFTKLCTSRGILYHNHDGYYYVKTKSNVKGVKVYFRCRFMKCPVRGIMNADLTNFVLNPSTMHNHPPSDKKLGIPPCGNSRTQKIFSLITSKGILYHENDGYFYIKQIIRDDKMYVKCHFKKCNVRGRTHVSLKHHIEITSNVEHIHEPDFFIVIREKFNQILSYRSENELTNLQDIFDEEYFRIPDEFRSFFSAAPCIRKMQKIRKNKLSQKN